MIHFKLCKPCPALNLARWEAAGRELEAHQKALTQRRNEAGTQGSTGFAPLPPGDLALILRMREVWAGARLRAILGKVGFTTSFDGRQN